MALQVRSRAGAGAAKPEIYYSKKVSTSGRLSNIFDRHVDSQTFIPLYFAAVRTTIISPPHILVSTCSISR